MAATSLILFALWAASPDSAFGETPARNDRPPNQRAAIAAETTTPTPSLFDRLDADSQLINTTHSTIARGQSVNGAQGDALSTMPPATSLSDHPLVHEFFSGMNPFVQEEPRVLEGYYDPFGWQASFGTNGVQPFRLGWVTFNELTLIPTSPTSGSNGPMKILEWNSHIRVSHVIAPGVLFNGTGWMSARWWDGPTNVPLPGQVDQFSTDLELGFFNEGPWSGQVAFHPQIVESFEAPLNRNAYNFDGRAIAMYRASPNWSFVVGIAFWDRVDLLVVPHVGAIWTPNDRWEFRLLFPRSRASYFLGQWSGTNVWLYGEAEYHVEAWQDTVESLNIRDRIQIEDERVNLGVRWDHGRYSTFIDGGYVFNRHAKFAGAQPGFDIGDMGMIRAGLRY